MICKNCKARETCKSLCDEVKKQLPAMSTGKLPKTLLFNGDYLEEIIEESEFPYLPFAEIKKKKKRYTE